MACFNNSHWLLSHIRNSFISTDDTGISEIVMHSDDLPKHLLITSKSPSMMSMMNSSSNFDEKNFYVYPGLDQSDEEDLSQSFEITMDQDIGFYRQRSNTAQKLEKMNMARKKAAMTKNIKCQDILPPEQQEALDDNELFIRKDINLIERDEKKVKSSMLTLQMQKYPNLPQNRFIKYAVFDGTSQTGVPTRTISIFIMPFPEDLRNFPVRICVLSSAKILEFIGLILYKCVVDLPEFDFEEVDQYGLFIAEENGEPDLDFPPLDVNENVYRFQFSHLALAKKLRPSNERAMSVTSENGTNSNIPDSQLSRQSSNVDTSKNEMINRQQTAELAMESHTNMMEATHYRPYRVNMLSRNRFKNEVQLGISGEKLEIDPLQQKSSKFWSRQKALHYPIEAIASCDILEQKSTRCVFRIVYSFSFYEQSKLNTMQSNTPGTIAQAPGSSVNNPWSTTNASTTSSIEYHIKQTPTLQQSSSFKYHDFEANPEVADEIVKKINNILNIFNACSRREYQNRKDSEKKSFFTKKKFPNIN